MARGCPGLFSVSCVNISRCLVWSLAYFDFSLTGVGAYRIRPNVGEHEMIDASIKA